MTTLIDDKRRATNSYTAIINFATPTNTLALTIAMKTPPGACYAICIIYIYIFFRYKCLYNV